jgi:hypothetical protein
MDKNEKPEWAQAAIIAEYNVDKSELITDYFGHTTTRRVFLAWSRHKRDLFPEMRKAAARFSETAHLGPGKDLYKVRVVLANDVESNGRFYRENEYSRWHSELGDHTFWTLQEAEAFVASAPQPESIYFDDREARFRWSIRRESIEHREKYSMGSGYYLKAGHNDSDGWRVEKTTYFNDIDEWELSEKAAA